MLIKQDYASPSAESDELSTKILHETWYKKRVSKKIKVNVYGQEDKKGKEITLYDTEVWVASWIEGNLLRNEKTEFDKYPIIAVASDNNPDEIGGEGYIKNLIPVNKGLNRLESQVLEYNNLVNRGRFISDKKSGVSKITNETGEIIEKNPGTEFKEAQIGGLSPDIHRQIDRFNIYCEDLTGVKEAFLGGVPSGVKSGIALESLKAQTANNLQDLKLITL